MRVVDSSAWIEWLTKSTVGAQLQPQIPDRANCIVPTIVQLELAKWLTRERDEAAADRFIAYSAKCVVVPLDTDIALQAAHVSAELKLATADAIVYATAMQMNADLLTCDAHFSGLAGVVFVEKQK